MVDLSALKQRKAELESRLAHTETALKSAKRADDSRRKIIIGGAVLAAMRAGEIDGSTVRGILGRHVADRDKRLFDGSSLAIGEPGQ
ncbi:hypothetical protein ANOBCDAF_00424 [Pleomorphomonas sp. T1.2MG-36]|uniref:hypothetical protein n=1 Tax=Pleomorphomonas sp. T1.2MG-36 TaxID=3041167 RepID=UPI002477C003|nr:hypothetical protein [Pleomorphomonas sp. T1.2MG-36]CAI9400145.1 hypothetical protein ANOBCDAF_00424 [Pleomorphomonas sp. T1.2MG-36]